MRYDLFRVGRSLDRLGRDFSWDDFAVFVKFAPRTSQLSQAVNGPSWSQSDMLAARLIDALWVGNWQRSGNRKSKKPTPLEVPGFSEKPKSFGSGALVTDIRDFLTYRNGRAPEMRS